jgi:hypothetical protein
MIAIPSPWGVCAGSYLWCFNLMILSDTVGLWKILLYEIIDHILAWGGICSTKVKQ